jgi:exopolysaccharide production protein ExoY
MSDASALHTQATYLPARPKARGPISVELTATRVVDVTLAGLALVFVAPLLVLLAVMIKIHDGGPALFAHRRVGHRARQFDCLKLRTMRVDSEERLRTLLATSATARTEWDKDHKLRDDPRVTPFGRFLRRSSLDELPQLLNIIRGDMSIVGPRPIVEAETVRYGRYMRAYCSVKPGLTGLWQVQGRNDVSYRRRVAMDVVYSRRKSFGLDLKIMVMTLPAVLRSRGAY